MKVSFKNGAAKVGKLLYTVVPNQIFAGMHDVFLNDPAKPSTETGKPVSRIVYGHDSEANCEDYIRHQAHEKGDKKLPPFAPYKDRVIATEQKESKAETEAEIDEPKNQYDPAPVQAESRVYAISAPKNREYAKVLESAKWGDVFQWAEAIRKNGASRGQYITVPALALLIDMADWPRDRREKAAKRLRRIYRDDCLVEAQIGKAYSGKAIATEPQTEKEPIGGFSKVTNRPATKQPKGEKLPGVIATIVTALREASKAKPATKESILEILKSKRPDKDPDGMGRTINSQIPACLKIEKGLIVKTDGKGGFWLPKE